MAYFGCINKSVSPPTPPEPNYLYKYDFTKSLKDEINGHLATLNGATQDENGLHFAKRTDTCQFLFGDMDTRNHSLVVEVEFGECDGKFTGSLGYLFSYSKNTGGYGFVKSNNVWWAYFNGSDWVTDGTWAEWKNKTIISNSNMQFIFSNNVLDVKLNGELVQHITNTQVNKLFNYIGRINGESTYYNMTIKSVKIYENEEEE